MELVTPGIGLLFWMTVSFLIVLFILSKFAWKPITKYIKDRENSIASALQSAEKAKEEMARLMANNEALLAEARNERDQMLKSAREAKERILAEAQQQAKAASERELSAAREAIHNEKEAAKTEIKNLVASFSLSIAEKLVKESLSSDEKQKALAAKLADEIQLN